MANGPVVLKRFVTGTTWDELYPKTTTDQVSGLATLLAGKVNDTGDTMTGDLSFSGNKGLTSTAYVKNASGGLVFESNTGYSFTLAPSGGTITVNGNKLTGLITPTADTEAATKAYVDGLVGMGLHVVDSVKAAVKSAGALAAITAALASAGTGNLPDNSPTVYVTPTDRILVANQATPEHNGIYAIISTTPFYSKVTADSEAGAMVFVSDGSYNDSQYVCEADGDTWALFSRVDTVAGTNLSRSGNTLSVVAAPTFTTQALNDNSTKAATTAFVLSQIANDAQPKDATLTGLAALAYGSSVGFVKMTGAEAFALDTTTYLSSVARNAVTDSVDYSLLLTSGHTTTGITGVYVDNAGDLKYNPATNILTAGSFVGGGSGLTSLNASNISSGTLGVANGGTGATTAIAARTSLGLVQITYADNVPTANLTAGDLCIEF